LNVRWVLLITVVCLALSFVYEAGAAGTSTVNITAVVLSKNKCKFNTANATIDFGSLDPSTATDITINATVDIVCNGQAANASFSIKDDDGQHFAGPDANMMQHATIPTEFLSYSLTYNPATATIPKGVVTPITLTGFLSGGAYSGAVPGVYSDTVTLTIEP
jgi:spore coat protein U-like protein